MLVRKPIFKATIDPVAAALNQEHSNLVKLTYIQGQCMEEAMDLEV